MITPVEDGWFIVCIPIPDPQPHTGTSLTVTDGTTQVLSQPAGPSPS